MLQFPNERAGGRAAQKVLQPEFDFACRLYNFWVTRPKDKYLNQSPLDNHVLDVAMIINVQACREYRTVVDLCKRRDAHSASIIARTLFETALATGFVLKPELRIRVYQPDAIKRPDEYRAKLPKPTERRKADLLSRDLRALLYIAHMALERSVFKAKSATKPGRKRYARTARVSKKLVSEVNRNVGTKWANVLMNQPRTYSGLSVAMLTQAVKYKLDVWYDTVYFFQSRHVHASSAVDHMGNSEDGTKGPQWLSPLNFVRGILQTGTLMFLVCLLIITEQIDFGTATSTGIAAFGREYRSLFHGPLGP